MKVEDLMARDVRVCRMQDTLDAAAHLMWEYDCGCLPVVDEDGHVVGMLTDRDICMAAFTQGRPLTAVMVATAMARRVYSCRPEDSIANAADALRSYQIRRLPVVAGDGRLVGMLSLADLAREAERKRPGKGKRNVTGEEVVKTLATVCQPREPVSAAV